MNPACASPMNLCGAKVLDLIGDIALLGFRSSATLWLNGRAMYTILRGSLRQILLQRDKWALITGEHVVATPGITSFSRTASPGAVSRNPNRSTTHVHKSNATLANNKRWSRRVHSGHKNAG